VERLRETAYVFIEAGSNARLAADRLFAHKNTVLYRLRRAETMRGRPLDQRHFELEVALRLVRTLGDWALPPG
jgi:DNA-binding PucR family transcriptional regulator